MSALVVVVVSTFSQTIEQRICEGLHQALSSAPIRLVFAPVGYLPPDNEQSESVLKSHEAIKALEPAAVVFYSGGIAYKTNQSLFEQVMSVYESIPQLHLGHRYSDKAVLSIDNHAGLFALLSELFPQRLPMRPLYISGPSSNQDSEQRHQAILDAMAYCQIPLERLIVLEGDYTPYTAEVVLGQYLDASTEPPDWVICANDLSAKGALVALQSKGIVCPDDCWLTGFDDLEYAQFMTPSLSSVAYPAIGLGQAAARSVQAFLANGSWPESKPIASEPIQRASTGAPDSEAVRPGSRVAELWGFIQERDMTRRQFEVMRSLHSQSELDQALVDTRIDLEEMGIYELSLTLHPLETRAEERTLTKTAYPHQLNGEAYELMISLIADRINYGTLWCKCHPWSAEQVERLAPLFAEIEHRRVTRQNNEWLREQNETAERMASLGRLVAGVAHEANTPIGTGKLSASVLMHEVKTLQQRLDGGNLTRQQMADFVATMADHARLIYSNLDRAASLISNFKQVSVDQSSEQQREIDLGEYIESILNSLTYQFKQTPIDIITHLDHPVRLTTYPGAIAQVLTNLLMNARQHGFENGLQAGRIEIALVEHPKGFQLTVSDNGAGIRKEFLPQLIEPFFTTARHRGGSGLGLHIVYNLVNHKLDWQVEFKSEPGKGFSASFTPKRLINIVPG